MCDFGVSRVITPGKLLTECCGTPAYLAPEIIKGKSYEDFAIDIWSTGILLYAMIYGNIPFKAPTISDLKNKIISGKYKLKPCASEEVRDLLTKMLEVDPKKRISISGILSHRWFSDYDPNICLLDDNEKKLITKEFLHTKNTPDQSFESDYFIEQDIDMSRSNILQNVSTKSLVFAPFNTSINETMNRDFNDTILDKNIIKLSSQVKDADRQYELNNNCEVDNGVYNKFAYETKSSLPLNSSDDDEDHKEMIVATQKSQIHDKTKKIIMSSLIIKKEIISNYFFIFR